MIRKNIIIVLISLCFSLIDIHLKAQTEHPFLTPLHTVKEGDYVKDTKNRLDPYVGEWLYQNESTIFKKRLS